jgi:hypothetical protein
VQPIGGDGVMILGADRARPLTGSDFGWLQAVGDRLGAVIAIAASAEVEADTEAAKS